MDRWEAAGRGASAGSARDAADSGANDGWKPVSRANRLVLLSEVDSAGMSSGAEGPRDMSVENRSSMRYDLGTAGRVAFDGDGNPIDCIIKNLSKTGACLELPVGVAWPETFTLEVHNGETRRVEAVWSENRIIGVRFLSEDGDWKAGERESVNLREHLLRSVQILQEELDRLRRIIETKL